MASLQSRRLFSKPDIRLQLLDQRVESVTKNIINSYLSSDLICVAISAMTGTQINYALKLAQYVRELTNGKVPIVCGEAVILQSCLSRPWNMS